MRVFEQMDDNSYIYGMRLIATTAVTKKIQIRRHHKKRINKKWAKRYGYREVPDYNNVIIGNGCIMAQPSTIDRIIEKYKEYGK